jgi:hypothetical protein
MTDRKRARELAEEFIEKGDPTGWFEQLYREGEEGKSVVPWADRGVNASLIEFWKSNPQATARKKKSPGNRLRTWRRRGATRGVGIRDDGV